MTLAPAEERLLRLAVCFIDANWDELRTLRRAAPKGEPDRAWREVALQAQLFAGFPRAIAGYTALAEEGGLGELKEGEARLEDDQPQRGAALFERIYSTGADKVRSELAKYHPDLEHFIERHAYGRILSRPGLSPRLRELTIIVSLAALGHERQIASHARGAIRCGAEVHEVEAALVAVEDLLGAKRMQHARRIVERFARQD